MKHNEEVHTDVPMVIAAMGEEAFYASSFEDIKDSIAETISWVRVCIVGNSNWESGWTSPVGIVSGRMMSSPIITVGYWLRGPCSPR